MSNISSPESQVELARQMITSIRSNADSVFSDHKAEIQQELQNLLNSSNGTESVKSKLNVIVKLAEYILGNYFVSEVDSYSLDSYHSDDLVSLKIEVVHQLKRVFGTFEGQSTEENLPLILDSVINNILGVTVQEG